LYYVGLNCTCSKRLTDSKQIEFIRIRASRSELRCNSCHAKYMVVVTTMAVMPIGTTAFATDNAFADGKKYYEKNQAVSQANDCGNGELPLNIGCQNTVSQIQGDENVVSLAAEQVFPEFEEEEPAKP
jgi:hypothetical protein